MVLVLLLVLLVLLAFGIGITAGLVSLVVMLVVAGIVGWLADLIVPGTIPFGWLGAILAGLVGAWLGTALIGNVGPSLAGIPIPELMDKATVDRLVQRTRDGGAEIVKYLKTGSAYYAPSAAATEMVEAILKDKKKILPCSVWLTGEYGVKDAFAGVPVKLGEKGMEQVLEINLTDGEKAAFLKSVEAVRTGCAKFM